MNSELKQATQQVVDAFDVFSDADDFVSLFALTQKMRALREAIQQAETQQPAKVEPVLTIEKEPDYWSGGHFHKGNRPHINPMKVWHMPIGTKLYTHPAPSVADEKQPATAIACGITGMAKTTCPFCEQSFAFEHEQPSKGEPVGQVFYAADGGDDETGAGYYMEPCVHWVDRAPPAGTKLYDHQRPEKVPMTGDERGEAYLKYSKSSEGYRSSFMRGVWAAEIHHDIKPKE